jgi:hypothetical protein
MWVEFNTRNLTSCAGNCSEEISTGQPKPIFLLG